MKRIDLAYLAGILDGEGSICITRTKPKGLYKHSRYTLAINITNTNEWLIRWIDFNFKGTINRTRLPSRRDCWRWQVHSSKAVEFLRLLLPYLKIKKPQAELALMFLARRKGHHWAMKKGKTDEQLALEEADRILMSKMNKGVV